MSPQSAEIDQISAALARFQSKLPDLVKTKTAKIPTKAGGEYSYKYADLADAVKAAAPLLSAEGLAVTQWPEWDGDRDLIRTQVSHDSGQWMSGTMRLFLAVENPQAHGSAITYGRRYAYCAAIGLVADEDDDGASATHTGGTTRRSSTRTTRTTPRRTETAKSEAGETMDGAENADPLTHNDEGEKLASQKQKNMLRAVLAHDRQIVDNGEIHDVVSAYVGRAVESLNDLTSKEASAAIDKARATPEPTAAQ